MYLKKQTTVQGITLGGCWEVDMPRPLPYGALVLALLAGLLASLSQWTDTPPQLSGISLKNEAAVSRVILPPTTLLQPFSLEKGKPLPSPTGHLVTKLQPPKNLMVLSLFPSRNIPSKAAILSPSPPVQARAQKTEPVFKPTKKKPAATFIAHTKAGKFKRYVDRYAAKFQISPSLIYAIIKTESNFKVKAVSSASACGLMQLVPASGGRAAYKMVYGRERIPSREYLYDPEQNIELGTAYLRHLAKVYFAGVKNPVSQEYCQIAAYNTGPANVFKAFTGSISQRRAIEKINELSPPEVFEHLRRNLPYEETRKYLPKVVSYKREFVTL